MMPYGWEGNRRSGVALAMRHTFTDFSVYPPTGLMAYGRDMSTPPIHSSTEYDTLYLYLTPTFVNPALGCGPWNLLVGCVPRR